MNLLLSNLVKVDLNDDTNIISQFIDPLFEGIRDEVEHLYRFILSSRQQISQKPLELNSIKLNAVKIQKEYSSNLEILRQVKDLATEKEVNNQITKIIEKSIIIFNSNKFYEGSLRSKGKVDLFTYIIESNMDVGTLQLYLSKVRQNIESSWLSFSQSYSLIRLSYIAL